MIDVSDVPHLRNAITVISYFVETVKGKKFSAKEFINRPQVHYCKTAREAIALEEKNWCEPILPYWKEALEKQAVPAKPITTRDGFVEVPSTSSVPCVAFAPVEEVSAPAPVAMPPPVPTAPEVKKGKK